MIRKSISISNRKYVKFTSLSPACNNNGMMIDRCLPYCYRNRANIISSRRINSCNGSSGSILTSFFSTNPSYDDDIEDDELDNDDAETTTWIKRSPGINNLSSTNYTSNSGGSSSYYQYEVSRSPPSPQTRPGLGSYTDRKQYDLEEDGSLLNLLNNNDSSTNQHQHQPRLDHSQRDRYNRTEEEDKEGSLLNLLNTSQSNSSSTYTTPISPRHYMPQSNKNEDEHAKINSFLGLLGGKTSIDEKVVVDNDNRKEGGEGSLLNLLGNVSDESLLYPTLNGYQQQQQQQQIEEEDDSSMLDLLASPPSTSTNSSNTKCYKHLQSLQLQLELESLTQSTTKQLEIYNSARDRSDYNTIPVVKRALDDWYSELNEIIEIEQWLYLNGDNNTSSDVSLLNTNDNDDIDDNNNTNYEDEEEVQTTRQRKVRDRSIYGPLLCLLPSRKLSVIVANSVLSASLSDKHGYIKVVQLAILISNAIEMEVNVSRALRVKAKERKIALIGNEEENDDDGMLLGDEEDDTPLNIDHRTIGGSSKKRVSIKPFNMNKEEEGISNKKSEGEGIIIDNWIYTATHLQRFLDELPGNGNNTDNGGNNQKSLKNIGQIRPEKVRKRCKEILLAEGFDMKDTREEDDVDNYSTTRSKENINDFVEWDPVQKVKLGCALIQLLLDNTTFTKPTKDGKQQQRQRHGQHTEPAFQYKRKMMGNKNGKAHGVIEIHPELHSIAVNEEFTSTSMYISPSLANSRVQPMVVPPNDWLGVNDGGYETIKVPFMRTRHCKTQKVST